MNNLQAAYNNFKPDALGNEDFAKFYIEANDGRGDSPFGDIKLRLLNDKKGSGQFLLSGYRGCVRKELDPIHLNYVELFTLTMEKLFETIQNEDLTNTISEELLKSVQSFTDTVNKETSTNFNLGIDGEVGKKTPELIEKLLGFFYKLRISSSASQSVKNTVNTVIEQRLSDLIKHCNDLIREIKIGSGGKGLVIFIEDLDKILLAKAEDLFYNYGNIINQLNTNVIFTFPISLKYNAKANVIVGNFDETFELPMIKIKTKAGENYDIGRNTIYNIITKRLDANSFESNDLIYKFIDKSGGCLRDVFRMVKTALDTALTHHRDTITTEDFNRGYLKLKRDYESSIAEKRNEDGSIAIALQEYIDTLKAVANSATKKEMNTEATMDLRQNLCVLSYNGEAILHQNKNEYTKAEQEYVEALDIYRKLAKTQPQVYLPGVAMTLNNLANLHKNKNEYTKAEQEYVEALDIYRKLAKTQPQVYLPDVAMTLNNLAILHKNKNEYTKAEQEYVEALNIYIKLAKTQPQVYSIRLANTLKNIAVLYKDSLLQKEKSLAYILEALQILQNWQHIPLGKEYTELCFEILKDWEINANDFMKENNISIVASTAEDDIHLYAAYLQSENAVDDEDNNRWSAEEWQDYDEIKEAYETDDADRNFPEWYEFYNSRRGTGAYMILPDIRGEKEEFYMELTRAEERSKNPQPPYIPENYLWYSDEEKREWFIKTFETKEIQEFYAAYEWSSRNAGLKEELGYYLYILYEADEPVAMDANLDWAEAVKRAAKKYRNQKIAEALPQAWEQYMINIQMNIAFNTEKRDSGIRKIYEDGILKGRKLNGEPENLDF
ncbi:unnamed protein product [Rotaria sp. Silwood1]|nr:unnamed protein product [Rotaria sp. Silwood1]